MYSIVSRNSCMKPIEDNEIIRSVVSGNTSDYSILIERYKDRAFSLLRRMLKNDMDAEEALQDSFVKTFRALKLFRYDATFSTWFYRIVYNTGISKLSSAQRKKDNYLDTLNEDFQQVVGQTTFYAERQSLNRLLNEIVNELPTKYATVINLFYLESMTCEEIAEIMQTSLSNVKVLLHRARKTLRDVANKYELEKELL